MKFKTTGSLSLYVSEFNGKPTVILQIDDHFTPIEAQSAIELGLDFIRAALHVQLIEANTEGISQEGIEFEHSPDESR